MNFLPSFILAILTCFIGMKIIKWAMQLLEASCKKKEMEPSLQGFILSVSTLLLKLFLLISVAGTLGIETTSFVAIIGAAGLAIGLAFQNTLGNFAASFLILTFKPFKTGDLVELGGHLGVVDEIQMFCTVLTTPNGKTIILPNGPIANGTIVNLSRLAIKRVDLTFGIGYSDNIEEAKNSLQRVIDGDSRILKDPGSTVAVSSLGDSSVNFVFRVWVKTDDYWDVYFAMQEQVKLELDRNKISIPFPQRDVHVFQMS
ncbi:MAG: mechanosensitive ion channel [Candidatus Nitronauta litoralis]|uniref:Mechanosensitive ion channel n=1 Tax=Candidatus Nitronauta litoralis TaxID=2705533 RepID=A0A7T0G1R4_9BACT|nr:MAG: mechanosensitive ion channel [Candidatus Nitronauta litoralis]